MIALVLLISKTIGTLLSIAVISSVFMCAMFSQEVHKIVIDDNDDDYFYPMYQPRTQRMPLGDRLVHVSCDVSRSRAKHIAFEKDGITKRYPGNLLDALVIDQPAAFCEHREGPSSVTALAVIARRKVINKKMSLDAQCKKLVMKNVPFEKDGNSKHDRANSLGCALLDHRTDVYKQREGRDNVGSTSTVGGMDTDLENTP